MIIYNKESGIITLSTKNTTYQMQVDKHKYLMHLYYGKKAAGDFGQLITGADRGFSGNPFDAGDERVYSLDQFPLEFPFRGSADFRTPAFVMQNPDGSKGCDLRFKEINISDKKYTLRGLPTSYANDGERISTVDISLADDVSGIEVHLLYGVFEDRDVITRAVRVCNKGKGEMKLLKVSSASFDMPFGDYDFITFHGRHAMERQFQRVPVEHGKYEIGSLRGASSHQYNPFVMLAEREAGEYAGDCIGIHFVYSGNFLAEAEKSQYGSTRVIMGLPDDMFSWSLKSGESFDAPEVLMAYSDKGFSELSNIFHEFIRENIERGYWKHRRRPVLINNWEATYFNFDKEKLISIAREASKFGVEMLVLDDGWFGKRESDTSGLGDWKVNTKKLGGTLGELSKEINDLGMKFGLWFEPEMISEDSDLFRAHPDWVIRIPDRDYSRSRFQLVLDFSRKEVVDYIFNEMTEVLDNANIAYIKWDMNRSLTDIYSKALSAECQGEMMHRFMLGTYDLLERLCTRYPEMLIEGCAGGGGRFDTGMLAYESQIWCSDNTDAIDRCLIQYGTSFGYPTITMGAHVSAVPNEQTGRVTPFETRGAVAMPGTFGYELDPNKLSEEDKRQIQEQIDTFIEDYEVSHFGRYYRLSDPFEKSEISAWMSVAKDKKKAIFTAVALSAHANDIPHFVKMRGLDPEACYTVKELQKEFTGASLMYGGLPLPYGREYRSVMYHLSCE